MIQDLVSFTGYKYLRELDKDLCVSFCLQDPKCTAVTYSVRSPQRGQNSSLCKFFTSLGKGVYLNLTEPVPHVDSRTILFISKLQDVHLFHAKLEGENFSETKTDQGSCTTGCREDFFCDAFNFAYTGICSMYSSNNIKNIVVDNNSEVSFLEHKSHDKTMPLIWRPRCGLSRTIFPQLISLMVRDINLNSIKFILLISMPCQWQSSRELKICLFQKSLQC